MSALCETNHTPQQFHPHTPTSEGFERHLQAWGRLPAGDVAASDAGDADAPRYESGAA